LVRDVLLEQGDYYMHLADLTAYAQTQVKVGSLYQDANSWTRKAIINVGYSGKFSSDRTVSEYVSDIWKVKAVPVK
jgi:glycogen phosphorylase